MSIVDTINVHDSTTLTLLYHGQGTGSGEFSIHIEGPLLVLLKVLQH